MSDFDDVDGLELSPKSAQSDTLRTRIEDALCDHEELAVRHGIRHCCCGWEGEFPYASHKEHVADAVIAALGLTIEHGGPPIVPPCHRYVTEWTADD